MLREIELHEGIQKIGNAAFASCYSLECIVIPHTVTEIAADTFFFCQRLREVGLHEGIQKIGGASDAFAFARCSLLERITFSNLSTRLDNIIEAGKYVDVENKVDNIRLDEIQVNFVGRRGSDNIRGPIERRGSELFISDVRLVQGSNWGTLRRVIGRIDKVLTHYELREATTLLDLALWKSKMDQGEVNPINRYAYRIDIPGPVKNTILQYLNFRV